MLGTAATAIDSGLGRSIASAPDVRRLPPTLAEPRASFVTLLLDRELRGCCGTLEPARPLLLDVWHNAPLTVAEWRDVELEVSVLAPCERVVVSSEGELLAGLVPGRDGLVIAWRGTRATFLPKVWVPKVWEQVGSAEEFLRRLKRKAGWAEDFWAADIEVWRYETEIVGPAQARSAAAPGAA